MLCIATIFKVVFPWKMKLFCRIEHTTCTKSFVQEKIAQGGRDLRHVFANPCKIKYSRIHCHRH